MNESSMNHSALSQMQSFLFDVIVILFAIMKVRVLIDGFKSR